MDTNSNPVSNNSANPVNNSNENENVNSGLENIVKKSAPTFPVRRQGPPSRGPILGRGKGGGVGNKGRIGMRTGTR